jgi:phosphatidylserine decarboxylase
MMLEPAVLLLSLIFLETGWLLRKERKSHLYLAFGWLLFSIYWPSLIHEYAQIYDYVNASFCAVAFPVLAYLAFNEVHLYTKNVRVVGMETIAGGTFIAALTYFFIKNFEPLAEFLRKSSAIEAKWFAEALNVHTVVTGSTIIGSRTSFELILACTALQSIMIFLGFIIAIRDDRKRKIVASLIMVPAIYILNIVRNGGIIFLSEKGIMDFDLAHNLIGKSGSLIALFLLALLLFYLLPTILDSFIEVAKIMKPRRLKLVARDGGFVFFIFFIPLFFFVYINTEIALIIAVVFFSLLLFLRDPERKIGEGIVSPADGRIISAKDTGDYKYISIFMSLLDVHVNRVPIDDRVVRITQRKGKHFPAYSEKAEKNFSVLTEMERGKVKQICGIFARRIVNYLKEGDQVRKGERLGLIRFGSRVDLTVYSDGKLVVRKGDRVTAGETTLIEE